ncbi:MAG TPA: hypothetical protein VGR32_11355 [Brevundimonas sp.]|jgi:hypothetical protein|uniref:hypothetical protein n=1 Tax=Brevundimonas sp. TaxID=1871086 RepID=UPI002DE32C77|nr:hypothetical protein [Brevundimonas sp.]
MRVLVLTLALSLPSMAAAQMPDAAPVIAAERAFAADGRALGIAGSFNKWAEPDGIVIAAGRAQRVSAVYPPEAVRDPQEPLLEWWPNFAGIAASGDLGFTTGGVAVNGQRAGHYFTVWRRQADGSWRWVYDGGPASPSSDVAGPDADPVVLPASPVAPMPADMAVRSVRVNEEMLHMGASMAQKEVHLTWLAPDARLYVARLPPATDPQAQAAALDAWPHGFQFGPAENGGVSAHGDLVWGYGPARWEADGLARTGHWVRLWQRRPSEPGDRVGEWRIVVAYLIPAPPPPATQ